MFNALRNRLHDDEDGFTLIELLVVVIIIGILAAIAIPTFLNQRVRGWEASAQSELRNAAIAQESYFTDNNSYAPDLAALEAEGFNNNATNINFVVDPGTSAGYCMEANHTAGGDTFFMSSTNGAPEVGACP